MRGGVAQMDPPAPELDEHEDVQRAEPGTAIVATWLLTR
jgi:hypothetical protein